MISIRRRLIDKAKATRQVPPGAEAADGISSLVEPEVRRIGGPVTFHVFGEMPIRHRFALSPERAEKASALPSASHAGENKAQGIP